MAGLLYEIDIKYNMIGNGAAGLGILGAAADKAKFKVLSLGNAITSLGLGFTFVGIARMATKAFIGFNSEVEQSIISLTTGIESMYDVSYEKAQRLAEQQKRQNVEFALKAPGSPLDYDRGVGILQPRMGASPYGLNENSDIARKLTAISLQKDAGGINLLNQVGNALDGNIRKAGSFMKFLNQANMGVEKWKKMSKEQRILSLEKMVNLPSFSHALTAQGKTFEAQWETLTYNVKMKMANVGKSLFKGLTGGVSEFNSWFAQNGEAIDKWAENLGKKLASGMSIAIDSARKFGKLISDNSDVLIAVAESFAIIKTGTMFAALIPLLSANAPLVIGMAALTAAVLAWNFLSDQKDVRDATGKRLTPYDKQGNPDLLYQKRVSELDPLEAIKNSMKNVFNSDPKADKQIKLLEAQTDALTKSRAAVISSGGKLIGGGDVDKNLKILDALSQSLTYLARVLNGTDKAKQQEDAKLKGDKPSLNATINNYNKIEIATNDPDRFAIQFTDMIQKQSSKALRKTYNR